MCSNGLGEKRSSFVYGCLQERRMPTRSYEHRVGAYGAVGFSGVKDARKSVFIADALASARHQGPESTAACDYWTGTGQKLDSHWTDTGQKLDNARPLRPSARCG